MADLNRTGRHPALGVVTLQQLLAAWVVHDLDHLIQISRVLARQYTDAVGPWGQYLRIVREPWNFFISPTSSEIVAAPYELG